MKRIYLFALIFTTAWFSSCEIIEAPYFEPDYLNSLPAEDQCFIQAQDVDPFPEGYTFTKKVFLEEMTGHKCGNCPRASEEALNLIEQYGSQLVFLSIHAGPLSNFTPGASKYFTDFTTEAGTEFYNTLNDRSAVPFGMVDRAFSGTDHKAWASQIESRLQEQATAGIRIYTCYDTDSAELAAIIDVKFLENGSESERLSVILFEEEVNDWQKDYSAPNGSPDIENYKHKNVLRSAMNGTWGENLSSSAPEADQVYTKGYSIKIKPEWNLEKLKILAFVYDFDTKEVRNVEEISLNP